MEHLYKLMCYFEANEADGFSSTGSFSVIFSLE